jgi:hypothetical protein
VPLVIPESFIKNLAILAGFLCLFVIMLTMIASTYNLAGIFEFVASEQVGPFTLLIDIMALCTLLVIYIFWWALWRDV